MKQKCYTCSILRGKPCNSISLDYYLECDISKAKREGKEAKVENVENAKLVCDGKPNWYQEVGDGFTNQKTTRG